MSKTRAKNLWSRIWLPNVVAISQEAFHRRLFRWTDEKVLGNGSMDWSTGYYLVDCFIFFAMSAIKWHVCFVDCSLIYANFQRLFVLKMFEFGANFGPRWFSLGFEFETNLWKNWTNWKRWTIQDNQLSCFGWVGQIMSWSEND